MSLDLAVESFKYDNDECWFEMMVKCKEFPSVNNMYGINTRSKVVYTLDHVHYFKMQLKDQIVFTDPKDHCPWIATNQVYYLALIFMLKHGFWRRDLDNMIKSTQDAIFQCLGINDARIIELHNYKNELSSDSPSEYLIIKVGLSNYQYNKFKK